MELVKGIQGGALYGFCLRNEHGDVMYAEVNYIGESTNTIAVARAIKATLTYYSSDGYDKVLLETDLLIMNNII